MPLLVSTNYFSIGTEVKHETSVRLRFENPQEWFNHYSTTVSNISGI